MEDKKNLETDLKRENPQLTTYLIKPKSTHLTLAQTSGIRDSSY